MIERVFLISLLSLVLPMPGFAQTKQVVVVIDAGHGGNDPGHETQIDGHEDEKELNLKISNFLGGYIAQYLQNVTVVYTRKGDQSVSLDRRVEIANGANADYFISVHCNGFERKSVHGTESHVHSMSLEKSVSFAREIESQFSRRAGRKSRGVKDKSDLQHSLQVLKFTNMSSVLVECGYITNPREAHFLNTTYGQEIIASAIFRAFRSTIQKDYPGVEFVKSSGGSTTSETGGVYAIQIMSSKTPISTDDSSFKKLEDNVLRKELNTTNAYRYIYTVGNYASRGDAKRALPDIQKAGFKDAFIIKR